MTMPEKFAAQGTARKVVPGVALAALLAVALAVSSRVARILKFGEKLGALIAIGCTICGGSAIAATAPAIEADDKDVAFAVGTITILGVAAMFLYPVSSSTAGGNRADDEPAGHEEARRPAVPGQPDHHRHHCIRQPGVDLRLPSQQPGDHEVIEKRPGLPFDSAGKSLYFAYIIFRSES